MNSVLLMLLIAVGLKALIIGSDYSIYHRIKYGRVYSRWYSERETFRSFLKRHKIV